MFNYGFPVFAPLALVSILFTFLMLNKIGIRKNQYCFIALYFFFVVHFLMTGIELELARSQFINATMTFGIMVSTIFWIRKNGLTQKLVYYVRKSVIFIGFVISIIGLIKFYLFIDRGVIIQFFADREIKAYNTALINDYNYAAAGVLIGLLFNLFKIKRIEKVKIFDLLYLLVAALYVLFSSSRRGLLLLIIIGVYYLYVLYNTKGNKIFIKPLMTIFLLGISFIWIPKIANTISIEPSDISGKTLARSLSFYEKVTNYQESSRMRVIDESYQIFKDYNVIQIIFGGGFSYLEILGNKSVNEEMYPHNQIVSHILFSGILGTLLLLMFYYNIIVRYLKSSNYKDIYLALFILISFSLFSGDTLFYYSPLIMLYLLTTILPKNVSPS